MNDFKLENNKIETGFIVPEGYFDLLSDTILNKVSQNKPKVIPFWQRKKTILMAVAATVVIAISIPIISIYNNSTNDLSPEIENYLSYNTNITDADIVELLDDETIENITIPVSTTEEIEQELLNNNIEQIITN
jgi:hypothetical protein